MKELKKVCSVGVLSLIIITLILSVPLKAQDPSPAPSSNTATVEVGSSVDTMRQDGKIYVVVAVILLIFSGMVIYLIRIDQKVSKLEKELRLNE